MPIQFPDMMQVPTAEEHRPFLSQLTKAMQLGVGLPVELKQKQIENALKQLQSKKLEAELPYAGPTAAAELALKQRKALNPLLGEAGAAGQIGSLLYLQSHPEIMQKVGDQSLSESIKQTNYQTSINPSRKTDYAKLLKDNIEANLKRNVIETQLKEAQAKNYAWRSLPVEVRTGWIAQGLGMNIDPEKMIEYYNQGKGIKEIAKENGFDPDNIPAALYFPTATTKSRVQQVQQVGHELDYVSSKIGAAIKPYANTYSLPILGTMSPQTYKDMFGTEEQQKRYGRYIGALSLQTGLATGRSLLEGTTRPGVEIMREVKNSSLKGISQRSPVKMTPTMFQAAQDFINDTLREGAQLRTRYGMSPLAPGSSTSSSNIQNQIEEKEDLSSLSDEEFEKKYKVKI